MFYIPFTWAVHLIFEVNFDKNLGKVAKNDGFHLYNVV